LSSLSDSQYFKIPYHPPFLFLFPYSPLQSNLRLNNVK
jgi:hypothetical protein